MTQFIKLQQLARKLEFALSKCLRPDGSWSDMPASYKRELLDLARSCLADEEASEVIGGEDSYSDESDY